MAENPKIKVEVFDTKDLSQSVMLELQLDIDPKNFPNSSESSKNKAFFRILSAALQTALLENLKRYDCPAAELLNLLLQHPEILAALSPAECLKLLSSNKKFFEAIKAIISNQIIEKIPAEDRAKWDAALEKAVKSQNIKSMLALATNIKSFYPETTEAKAAKKMFEEIMTPKNANPSATPNLPKPSTNK